jgi:CheY-like chemotaxis protein
VTASDTERTTLSVLIVDSDERVRESLAGLLEIGRRCVVVACAGTPSEALELLDTYRPDVVLLDPRLPELDAGRALIGTIRLQRPSTRIVLVGASASVDEAGFDSAADAYVRKTFRPKELLGAIDTAVGARAETRTSQPTTVRSRPW